MRAIIKRLIARRAAYQRTFLGDDNKPHRDAEIVLADLRRFCQFDQPGLKISPTSGMADPLATAYAAGMRDMFLRITRSMHLDDATIQRLTEPQQTED